MAIQTQQSFSGFVASDPQLSRTENGDARLYMEVGKEHSRQEQDGSFTQLETTFHNLVAFKAAAEQGHERLAKGDKVIADGYVREYSYQRDGQNVEGEESPAAWATTWPAPVTTSPAHPAAARPSATRPRSPHLSTARPPHRPRP